MWIFLTRGLIMPVSVPASADPKWTENGRFNLQVRSRVRIHLSSFMRRVPATDRSGIHETPSMDYQYRFYTTKEAFLAALWPEVDEIDYTKFKPAAGIRGGWPWEAVLNDVWSLIYSRYGGWGEAPRDPVLGREDNRMLDLLEEVTHQWETDKGNHYLVPVDLIHRIERFVKEYRDAGESSVPK